MLISQSPEMYKSKLESHISQPCLTLFHLKDLSHTSHLRVHYGEPLEPSIEATKQEG